MPNDRLRIFISQMDDPRYNLVPKSDAQKLEIIRTLAAESNALPRASEQPDEAVTKDAARYRVIRLAAYNYGVSNPSPCELDAKLDAARAKSSTYQDAK